MLLLFLLSLKLTPRVNLAHRFVVATLIGRKFLQNWTSRAALVAPGEQAAALSAADAEENSAQTFGPSAAPDARAKARFAWALFLHSKNAGAVAPADLKGCFLCMLGALHFVLTAGHTPCAATMAGGGDL